MTQIIKTAFSFISHVYCKYKTIKLRLYSGFHTYTLLANIQSQIIHLSRVMKKPTFWFPTWSDTNQAVQLQKIDRGLKFRVLKAEGLYFLCSENKGADQLRGYREADLRLCFRICKMLVFSRRCSFFDSYYQSVYHGTLISTHLFIPF